jgi:5S rRNA maturation endonuclease (ribonuclease M5)
MNDIERLADLVKVLDELVERNLVTPVIVEGRNDVEALRILGLKGKVYSLNHGIPLFNFCEEISREHNEVIILTDWDSKGGKLARSLREGFKANAVEYNDRLRARLVRICKKEGKDVESLPRILKVLEKRVGRQRS